MRCGTMGLSALSLMALAGCTEGFAFSLPGFGGAAVPALALRGGDVVAAGPDGYCVAPAASNARSGFALLAGCDVVGGGADRPSINALITVQAGAADTAAVDGSEQGFHNFLDSDAGRTALSRTGDAETIELEAVTHRDGRVTAVFADESPDQVSGFQAREWRSFMDVNDRLVTVSVRGLAGAPLSDAAGRALLTQAVGAIRDANLATDDADTETDAG